MALTIQILHGCVAQKLIGLHSDATYIFPENEVRSCIQHAHIKKDWSWLLHLLTEKKGASFLPLPLKNKVSSQLVHPIFVWSSPWKTLLCACSVSDLVECYLQRWSWIPIYRYFMDNVFKIFWFCLFVVIEQKFWGGITLYVYTCIHTFRFNII